MGAYHVVNEDTEFTISGISFSDDPPVSFDHTAKLDRSLSEILLIEDKKVAVKGSYWQGPIPGTNCSAKVEVVDTNFKHNEEGLGICTKKDKEGFVRVTVYSGIGHFVSWRGGQEEVCFEDGV